MKKDLNSILWGK